MGGNNRNGTSNMYKIRGLEAEFQNLWNKWINVQNSIFLFSIFVFICLFYLCLFNFCDFCNRVMYIQYLLLGGGLQMDELQSNN